MKSKKTPYICDVLVKPSERTLTFNEEAKRAFCVDHLSSSTFHTSMYSAYQMYLQLVASDYPTLSVCKVHKHVLAQINVGKNFIFHTPIYIRAHSKDATLNVRVRSAKKYEEHQDYFLD